MDITKTCTFTGEENTLDIPITLTEYFQGETARLNGAHIQDAFPQLNADHREFLSTGITPTSWAEMFGEDE